MAHFPASDGRPAWRVSVLTLFPDMFPGPLGVSLVGQALAAGLWSLTTLQIRDFGLGKHRQVDDTPAGGGAGMVLRADVLGPALDAARSGNRDAPMIYLSPRGRPLNQDLAKDLAAGPGAVLLAGRFEGIDERVIAGRELLEVSIGDYVLSGGELAAMVLIDTCVRLLPGVLGAADSLASESFESGLLEYPHYTRPREWEGKSIPDVLLSGDHKAIEAWRRAESLRVTAERRPDLLVKKAAP
ncbi:MAG TPA: tRNA (guanosine(37)-N1)-methyltransferase TrmD [Hyphomicrobium sp.]|nr:tRNA (guanosine(37)-N1)-methyltransferase TrmD [Hyphomicrobium sp.]